MDRGLKFKATSAWKEINFAGEELSKFGDEEFDGLISMQELTDYEIICPDSGQNSRKQKLVNKTAKKPTKKETEKFVEKNEKLTKDESDITSTNTAKKKRKRRKTQEKSDKEHDEVENDAQIVVDNESFDCAPRKRKVEFCQEEPKYKRKKLDKINEKESVERNEEVSRPEKSGKLPLVISPLKMNVVTENDLPGWKGLYVPNPVLKALKELDFKTPTAIQALTLPSAIRDRKDIVGAAETGSGKTLAFAIPLLHHILAEKAQLQTQIDELLPSEDVTNMEVADENLDLGSNGSTDTSDNEEFPPKISSDEDENEEDTVEFQGDEESDDEIDEPAFNQFPLYSLIITPTRELAIQVQNHIRNIAKYTDVRVVTLVGGMSLDKQRRLLKKRPEIVVATPGRLWDLMQEGEPHLAQIPHVPYFVIDECDRMVEKGHFQELSSILELMNSDEKRKGERQTFIFSATLTFVHDAPNRFKKKKKMKTLTSGDKLENLISQIGIKAKPKVIDLTKTAGTAETLTETKILCSVDDKDVYLYYFVQRYPGRTLVFTNSKDCLRRILSILTLLKCTPMPLHADMHQKQRLKNFERFTASPNGLLVATDVAARGLDIPDVQHVIHFQVPQTTENYIHRSGRTARAEKEGLSLMIVGPDDIKNYRKILRSLKRTEDIPQLPVDLKYLSGIKERVDLARSIDQQEHKKAKVVHHNNWFIKAAREMDIELEEGLLRDTGDSRDNLVEKSRLQQLRSQLNSLLKTPVISQNVSLKYPTMTGRLVVPYMPSGQALDQARNSKPIRINTAESGGNKNLKKRNPTKKRHRNNVQKMK